MRPDLYKDRPSYKYVLLSGVVLHLYWHFNLNESPTLTPVHIYPVPHKLKLTNTKCKKKRDIEFIYLRSWIYMLYKLNNAMRIPPY